MDSKQAGAHWNDNADAWTRLVRAGHDVFRDHLNSPAFFEMLPDVTGKLGLDVGCGEGHNTRQLAKRCLGVTALDYSEIFVRHANSEQSSITREINYLRGNAVYLPFASRAFDFVTAFMSLMDCGETSKAIAEIVRVLRPEGFLQFSITHPCFNSVGRKNVRDDQGRFVGVEVGDYFGEHDGTLLQWIFSTAPDDEPEFKVPIFHHTISGWVNLLTEHGLTIEAMQEPRPTDAALAKCKALESATAAPLFLHIRARKAGA